MIWPTESGLALMASDTPRWDPSTPLTSDAEPARWHERWSSGGLNLSVLGVEPDEAMAVVARNHAIRVELARFETWDPAGRTFDVVTAGHAWHWVDPNFGLAKVASVLNPGGAVALFWNCQAVDACLAEAFDGVYAVCAPELEVLGRDPMGSPEVDPFSGSDQFSPGETRTYRWRRELSADDWVSMLATFSDHHRRLGGTGLHELQRTLREAIILCLVIATHLGMTALSGGRSEGAFRPRLGFWSSAPAAATKRASLAQSRLLGGAGALDLVVAACRPGRG